MYTLIYKHSIYLYNKGSKKSFRIYEIQIWNIFVFSVENSEDQVFKYAV